MMRNNVYTLDAEEKISGYKLSPKQKKDKKDHQDKFDDGLKKTGKK